MKGLRSQDFLGILLISLGFLSFLKNPSDFVGILRISKEFRDVLGNLKMS